MRLVRAITTMALAIAATASAADSDQLWQIGRTGEGVPFAISASEAGKTVLIRFECAKGELVATAYGATGLTDPETGKEIGDEPASTVPAGAARLALVTDKVESDFVQAQANANPVEGWDLTIRLPADNPAVLTFPRADFIGLLTSGGGNITGLGKRDRKHFADFVSQCRAGEG